MYENCFEYVDFRDIKLSDFKDYKPKTYRQRKLKNRIIKAIKRKNVDGLFVPIYEPSFVEGDYYSVQFLPNKIPANFCTLEWWENAARIFCPERKSRLANIDEYFLIIAYLIKNGDITWYQAADNSSKIGNYYNCENSNNSIELTGTRKCGKFYGFVGNTVKVLKTKNGYVLAGGSWENRGEDFPLASAKSYITEKQFFADYDYVGLIVLEI